MVVLGGLAGEVLVLTVVGFVVGVVVLAVVVVVLVLVVEGDVLKMVLTSSASSSAASTLTGLSDVFIRMSSGGGLRKSKISGFTQHFKLLLQIFGIFRTPSQ